MRLAAVVWRSVTGGDAVCHGSEVEPLPYSRHYQQTAASLTRAETHLSLAIDRDDRVLDDPYAVEGCCKHNRVDPSRQLPRNHIAFSQSERLGGKACGHRLGTVAELAESHALPVVVHEHLSVGRGCHSRLNELPEIAAEDGHLPGSHRAVAAGPFYVGLHMGAGFVDPAVAFGELQHGAEAVFPFLAEFLLPTGVAHPAAHSVYGHPEMRAVAFLVRCFAQNFRDFAHIQPVGCQMKLLEVVGFCDGYASAACGHGDNHRFTTLPAPPIRWRCLLLRQCECGSSAPHL